MTEERRDDQDVDEPAEDLDVPESESEEVKGGSLNFSKIEFSYRTQKVMPTDQIPTDQKWGT